MFPLHSVKHISHHFRPTRCDEILQESRLLLRHIRVCEHRSTTKGGKSLFWGDIKKKAVLTSWKADKKIKKQQKKRLNGRSHLEKQLCDLNCTVPLLRAAELFSCFQMLLSSPASSALTPTIHPHLLSHYIHKSPLWSSSLPDSSKLSHLLQIYLSLLLPPNHLRLASLPLSPKDGT